MTEDDLRTITKFVAELMYKRQPPKKGSIPSLLMMQKHDLHYYIAENGPEILRNDSHMRDLFIQIYCQIAEELFAIYHRMGWQQVGDLPPKN